ncbi:MAG TPA: DUF72 domain-containing protein [Opitutaceae bacterium]|nr:DUF72 domain-containing protein [Opitutaceae bacterium]
MKSPRARAYVGISGWTYAPWRGVFYPRDLVQREELAYAARHVRSIEINGTFYSLHAPTSYAKWAAAAPEGFVYSVKGPRFITHLRRLKDVATPLANFFASGVLKLGEKLGPFLWQLPPSFRYDHETLRAFFEQLPPNTHAAAALARQHDANVRQVWFDAASLPTRPLRHALEVRHESFRTPEFVELLRAHGVALVVADTAGRWPFMEDITADFIYVRLHGDAELYVSGYSDEALAVWARKIRMWLQGRNPTGAKLAGSPAPPQRGGRDVHVYFDNDVKTRAPFDAMNLLHQLKLGPQPPPMPAAPEAPVTLRGWSNVRAAYRALGRRARGGGRKKTAARGSGGVRASPARR